MANQGKFFSIGRKLLLTLLAVSLIPLLLLGLVTFTTASNALRADSFKNLEAVRTLKAQQVESYFQTITNQMATFSEDRMVIEAMLNFKTAVDDLNVSQPLTEEQLAQVQNDLRTFYNAEFGTEYRQHNKGQEAPISQLIFDLDSQSLVLQSHYIVENPFALGEKYLLDQSGDGSSYDEAHKIYHPVFRSYINTHPIDDILLVDPKTGDIVYSVSKGIDLSTSLYDGPYAQTGLGRAFRLANTASSPQTVEIADYEPYAPSYQDPAAFIAAPIFDGDEKVGVAIFRFSLATITNIMQERAGLGTTGETYLVGPDKLWRSDSLFLNDLGVTTTILNPATLADTLASQSALDNQSGTQLTSDYRQNPVLSSWAPVIIQGPTEANPKGLTWALIAEISASEVRQPVNTVALITIGLVLAAVLIVVAVAFLFTRAFTQQIKKITAVFGRIGEGDYTSRADVVSSDEIGTIALGLNEMLNNTVDLIQTREERDGMQIAIMKLLEDVSGVAEGDLTVEAEVTADMTGAIADSFNFMIEQLRNIIQHVQAATLQVSASANEVQTTTEYLANGSETQAAQIINTSAAIDEMSISIQQVSENALLSASVGEQATLNARRGTQAVQATIEGMERIRQQVEETGKRIARLGRSSEEINKIVQIIGDIADRTSILALNASIQAAAAGDAGRGFAVVAEEVERLAERSTEATRQIATLTRTIQSETEEAVASMKAATTEALSGTRLAAEAGGTLNEIQTVSNRLSELILSISQASKQQARGSEMIARAMNDIAEVTQQTAAGTKQAAVSINHLAVLADDLRNSVSAFRLPNRVPTTSSQANGHSGHQNAGHNGGHNSQDQQPLDPINRMELELLGKM